MLIRCFAAFVCVVGCWMASATLVAEETKPSDQPEQWKLLLEDDVILLGQFATQQLVVDTQFGQLQVPLASIQSITPGLQHRPAAKKLLESLVADLGHADAAKQETAKKGLVAMGPSGIAQLSEQAKDASPVVAQKLEAIVKEIEGDEGSELSSSTSTSLIEKDRIVTDRFTILGTVVQGKFKFASKYGQLEVELADILSARRGNNREDVQKKLSLSGQYIVQKKTFNTRIEVSQGDRIYVSASGRISRSGSSSYYSDPNGNSRLGSYKSSPTIYGGALIARIGSSGSDVKVGTNGSFVAKRDGVLHLAIAMSSSYATRYQFPGTYQVKLRVKRE